MIQGLTIFSVIALSNMYNLSDPRLAQILVKGDLMVPDDDGRIMTRSRAKLRKLSIVYLFQRYSLIPM
jgi:hypothetical protein